MSGTPGTPGTLGTPDNAATAPLDWGVDALRLALLPLLPGLTVQVVASIGSTNTELLRRARALSAGSAGQRSDAMAPTLLVAEQQTAGRGRQGKAWWSEAGASLTFSLGLPLAPGDWSGLSLAVGLALADALDPLPGAGLASPAGPPPRLGLKWPNDLILLDDGGRAPHIGRKLGGILIETVQVGVQRLAVIGIGLNIRPMQIPADAPPLAWGRAWVQELQPGLDAAATLARVAVPLVQAIQLFEARGFAPLCAAFAQRDVLVGRAVRTTLANLPNGVADGVDANGQLWLRVQGQRHAVVSGDVSLAVGLAVRQVAPC